MEPITTTMARMVIDQPLVVLFICIAFVVLLAMLLLRELGTSSSPYRHLSRRPRSHTK
jgi:hypothetical protein